MTTNLPQQATIQQYVADGVTTNFNYNFQILASEDMQVFVTPAGQNANPAADLVPPDQYTVTDVGVVTGGEVQFLVAPAVDDIVTLVRNMQLEIQTSFSQVQTFNGQALDNAFRRVTLMLQQIQGNYMANSSDGTNGTVGSISRSLQYVVNTYLPTADPIILPLLTETDGVQTDNYVWVSVNGGISKAPLFTGGDANTLQALLASQAPTTAGSSLVGFYDETNLVGTTVYDYLNDLAVGNTFVDAARLQAGYAVSADDTGIVNALEITLTPPLTAYAAYNRFYVKVAVTNTGASTIDVDGLGAKAITYADGSAIVAGVLVAGEVAELMYDGTQFQVLNPFIKPASTAQTLAGTDNSRPVTPAALSGAFPVGAVSTTLPGGLIIKTGQILTVGVGATGTLTFPTPFPTALLGYSVTPFRNTAIAAFNAPVVSASSASAISVTRSGGDTPLTDCSFEVIAIGH